MVRSKRGRTGERAIIPAASRGRPAAGRAAPGAGPPGAIPPERAAPAPGGTTPAAPGGAAIREPEWAALIPDHDWSLYREVLTAAAGRGLRCAIGGGFAFSAYARRWRDTKDLDLYIRPEDREPLRDIVHGAGFTDYYDVLAYDRGWIYRAHREGVIVDLIWGTANYLTRTDEVWLTRGPEVRLRGLAVRLLPVEELIWAKLYVLQRDRCDWPDLLNVLRQQAATLSWEHLLARVGDDVQLLGGLLCTFGWLCAEQARMVPESVWRRVGVLPPPAGLECDRHARRVRLLDGRDWFGPVPAAGGGSGGC